MNAITLIFPDQLFEAHPALQEERTVCLAEEFLFYKVQPFHKQRLLLLRAAMRSYEQELQEKGKKVCYIDSESLNQRGDLFRLLAQQGVRVIHLAEFADQWLLEDLHQATRLYGWSVHFYPSPGFVSSHSELSDFFAGKQHYSMAHFYAHQRKKLNILMENGSPVGGKYSFDSENRRKLPKNFPVPLPFRPNPQGASRKRVDLLSSDIEREFPQSFGKINPFSYPVNRQEAHQALDLFLKTKLALFGDYQDAMAVEEPLLFHSLLSPLINIGLLTPLEVVQAAVTYATHHEIPLNSLEGFIRQIIGWREFMYAAYVLQGKLQRGRNFFGHKEKIPPSFWQGKTGILPVDLTVRKAIQTGYCHHIERLMVLGNFFVLTETDPHEVYQWFMSAFIDAYDWVMVPNIYGMSQYADGGFMVTKPYISGSNYLKKMSNYPSGDWVEIWDGLFWRFLQIHRPLFAANYRMRMLTGLLDEKKGELACKIARAESWLENYRK